MKSRLRKDFSLKLIKREQKDLLGIEGNKLTGLSGFQENQDIKMLKHNFFYKIVHGK